MDQLTQDLLPAVPGTTNYGQGTKAAVNFAQDYVYTYGTKPYAGLMGHEVSYFAQNGLVPSLVGQ